MKIGLIKERKSPPDARVALTPAACARLLRTYADLEMVVESSDIRAFTDKEYREMGVQVVSDVSDCDVLIGVKEVPIDALIPGKKYFFFSHTIKKQPYNRELLRAVLRQGIDLYDHETLTDESGHHRLVAFGRYAGIVGAYNGLIAYGLKTGQYRLPRAGELGSTERIMELVRSFDWPPLRIVLTGTGRAGSGAAEVLDCLPFERLSPEEYLRTGQRNGVVCQLDVLDYNRKTAPGAASKEEFFRDSAGYESDFYRYMPVTDLFMAAHLYKNGSPLLLTAEDLERSDFRPQVIADISCDIGIPIASTLRASKIAEPFYGYDPVNRREVPWDQHGAVMVMAVDNLPGELPREASDAFAQAFEEQVVPSFFDRDSKGILQRSQITRAGVLTEAFAYLHDYVGK